MCETNVHDSDAKDCDPQLRTNDNVSKQKAIYIDEALGKIKFGIFNYILILLSGTVLTAFLMEMLGVSFVLPVSQCDLKLSTKQKGIVNTVALAGIICSSHLWGYLADTKGRKRVIQPTLFIAFCLSVCSSFANDFYIFAVLRFLNGFFMCASTATIYTYVGEFHDGKQRSRAIMGSAVIYGITGVLLPLIAWLVINQDWMFYIPIIDIVYKPWRLFMIICALPAFFVSVAISFLPETPKYVLGQGDQVGALEILREVNRWNNGKNAAFDVHELCEETESIENRRRILENKNCRFPLVKSIWNQTVPLFRPPYLASTLLVCALQFLIYTIAGGIIMWFPDVMNRIAIQNVNDHRFKMCEIINMPMNTSRLTSEEECITKLELDTLERGLTLEIAYALGFILIGFLINRVGKFPIIITVLTVCSAAGVVCAFSYIPMLSTYAFVVLLCNGMAGNILNAAIVDIFPTNFRAMSVSISFMFGRLGGIVGSNIFALLIDNYCDLAFLLFGLSQIVAGILSFFIPKIHEKPSKSDTRANGPRSSVSSRID